MSPAVVRAALSPEKHGLRFHDLRYTRAALYVAAGADGKLISARLLIMRGGGTRSFPHVLDLVIAC